LGEKSDNEQKGAKKENISNAKRPLSIDYLQ